MGKTKDKPQGDRRSGLKRKAVARESDKESEYSPSDVESSDEDRSLRSLMGDAPGKQRNVEPAKENLDDTSAGDGNDDANHDGNNDHSEDAEDGNDEHDRSDSNDELDRDRNKEDTGSSSGSKSKAKRRRTKKNSSSGSSATSTVDYLPNKLFVSIAESLRESDESSAADASRDGPAGLNVFDVDCSPGRASSATVTKGHYSCYRFDQKHVSASSKILRGIVYL